jgi:drug/metabolite transporter (DMT)-like permease
MAGTFSSRPSGAALDWIVFSICVVMWGSSFALLKVAVAGLPALHVTLGRMVTATLFLLAILPLMRAQLPPRSHGKTWRTYAAVGVVGTAFPFFLFAFASERAPSAIVAICHGGAPFFTALLAHVFLAGEKLNARRVISIFFGFASLVVLVSPRLASESSAEAIGVLAGIAGAFLYAVANVQVKTASPVAPVVGAALYCMVGAMVTAPFAVSIPVTPPPLASALAVLVLGVGSTALGGILYIFLIRRCGPVFVSFVTYLMPLWALFLGVTLLGERPDWTAGLALGLVIIGLVLFNWQSRAAR